MTGWYIDFSLFNTMQLIHDFVYFSGLFFWILSLLLAEKRSPHVKTTSRQPEILDFSSPSMVENNLPPPSVAFFNSLLVAQL
jgi:hypothetical protein